MLEFGRITTKNEQFLGGDIEALSAHMQLVMMQFRPKFKDILFQNPLHTELAQRKRGL
jgi:hypothetical protein